MKTQRILVTGGDGFIGSNLFNELGRPVMITDSGSGYRAFR